MKVHSRCQQKIHVCIPGSSSRSTHYWLCANNKDECQAKLQMNINLHKLILPWAMVSTWWTLCYQANIPTIDLHISVEQWSSHHCQDMFRACVYVFHYQEKSQQLSIQQEICIMFLTNSVTNKNLLFQRKEYSQEHFSSCMKDFEFSFPVTEFYPWSTANLYSRWRLM